MDSLSGNTVIITGGAGGLGKAFAKKFLLLDYKVCICDNDEISGEKVKDELCSIKGADKITFIQCDVTSDESLLGVFDHCRKTFGRVDILINNAGIAQEKDFVKTIEVNLIGSIRGTELALKQMSKVNGHNGGKVINIASISGVKVVPFGPFYGASKSGIVHYTRTAGHPFHFNYTGVSIKCLCPSFVETPFMENKSNMLYNEQCEPGLKSLLAKIPPMKPEEVAEALIQLLEKGDNGAVMVLEKGKEPYYVPPSLTS